MFKNHIFINLSTPKTINTLNTYFSTRKNLKITKNKFPKTKNSRKIIKLTKKTRKNYKKSCLKLKQTLQKI